MPSSDAQPVSAIPITVIAGYLGAGKTTLLNRLLLGTHGRKLGVIVNDFGSLPIDIDRLRGAGDGELVNLPNGCVCCSLGGDLHQALSALADAPNPPEQIVVEVSGVANPNATAAWGTTPGFAPGGVITVAAADQILERLNDKYVAGEVRRQLEGADLTVITRTDLIAIDDRTAQLTAVEAALDTIAPDVPRILAVNGDVPIDLVLGFRPIRSVGSQDVAADHGDDYVKWSHESDVALTAEALTATLDDLPTTVLRLKGTVALGKHGAVDVDVVGRTRHVRPASPAMPATTRLVAIGRSDRFDPAALDALFATAVEGSATPS